MKFCGICSSKTFLVRPAMPSGHYQATGSSVEVHLPVGRVLGISLNLGHVYN